MLKISKTYITRVDETSRLCADLTIGNRRTTLWFGVDRSQEEWLALGRADAFVMALLPGAMRGGHEIVCEDPMSERLHYQLTMALIPALASAGDLYHLIKVSAPLTTERVPAQGAIGTGFSGGVDSLYTIMRHGTDSEFPLTHIAVFHSRAVYDKDSFIEACRHGGRFAQEMGLKSVYLDTNLSQALSENYAETYTFRNFACALALQGLFSKYYVSSGPNASKAKFDLNSCDRYDLLSVPCISTESLSFYLSGVETTRSKKLEALTSWEPSWRWLHPCIRVLPGGPNCGQCKKCACDLTVLYALGALDRYRPVFNVDDYLRHFPQRIGLLLSYENSYSCMSALQLLKERDISIPNSALSYAKQIRRVKRYLEAKLGTL